MNPATSPKYHFLVVDDDIHLHTTFTLMLEFHGHEVRTAHTGEAALALLEKVKFDVIITEYWLPGMQGDELAAIVRQHWPDQPIILATTNVEDIQGHFHPPATVDCLLNKPFSMLQLREAILGVLDRYEEIRRGGSEAHQAPEDWLGVPKRLRNLPRPDDRPGR
ncbi:MAG TPA: response regulator [Candidatus Acidoferrales bacterium]|nr:response regulator [Candidatus Acidoferrales bacterium]